MSGRPRIGVTTSAGGGRYMWWFYWLSMHLLGAAPVRLLAPLDKARLSEFDGFIIGGGDDIGAELYGAEAPLEVKFDPARDAMELSILDHALPRDMPVLGVCRGAQMLNVHLGGTLHQDVRAAYDGVPRMWTPLPRKLVRLRPGTRLHEIMGEEELDVNSLHNQAIDRLGEGLTVSGRDEYGVVQAVEDPARPFRVGVQWHPEFLIYRASQRRLFRAFIEAVEREA
ncbi:MAG: gamma-glutamyl-gamma-aminobutyrate hydrolase family protein [Pseudomonadota bacterium]